MVEKYTLDEMDLKILYAIQNSPDAPISDIGELVGLSQTPCWRRLKRMQDAGIMRERVWLLDADKLGLSVNVFAEVRLKQHDEQTLEAFEDMTRQRPEIVECFSMSGQSDYLLRILVGSVADYERFLKKILLHLPGVGSINSSFALQSVKITTDLPLRPGLA
ncbi:MAG: Lrp/AsnC family transcriptional regulator [Sphingobium sp.]|nr:Lrp/AsnC family transcriptional regulator [Sphingobium sp.]